METTQQNPVAELVQEAESNYVFGFTTTSKYVSESFYDNINTIEAYLNSKHITGETDSMGREKPFFNIVLASRNIWARATDLDTKNIRAKAGKQQDMLASYLFTIHLQRWMKEEDFGTFLNNWGIQLASFNSAIVKFVENSDGLTPVVMNWNNMIVDTIDFDSNIKIEIIELTPAQLKKRKGYDKEQVDRLLDTIATRTTQDGQTKDIKSDYIKLYEVHGQMPSSYLTGDEKDKETYVQQMHVISLIEGDESGKFDSFTLISGKEKIDPYMLTWLLPSVDGSISLMGSVKSLFQSQWMANYSVKLIKDQLDLTSKVIFQSSDPTFANQNIIASIETGQIMYFNRDKDPNGIQQINNSSHDITSLQNFGEQWRLLGQEITSTPDALLAKTPPSGTAYRQTAIVTQEAHSNFDLMTQNKGLHIGNMFKRYITPYLLKKMDNTDEISATLGEYGIDKIELAYIGVEAKKRFKKKAVKAVLDRDLDKLPNIGQEEDLVRQELSFLGDQRFIKPSEITTKTWKDILKSFELDVIYEITDENVDKLAVFETLNSVFATIVGLQGREMTKPEKIVFNKILEEVGVISPVELNQIKNNNTSSTPQQRENIKSPAIQGAVVQ